VEVHFALKMTSFFQPSPFAAAGTATLGGSATPALTVHGYMCSLTAGSGRTLLPRSRETVHVEENKSREEEHIWMEGRRSD
jgi:hypothetical protein